MDARNRLCFGTAGTPLASPGRSTLDGIPTVAQLGLDCMELEFVRGVRMSAALAAEVKKAAEHNSIQLSAHGPYYINLNSPEQAKNEASVKRILETARIAHAAGASTITFHAAYYMGTTPEEVYRRVKEQLSAIIDTLALEDNPVWIRPETTGKPSQFGTVPELIRLSQELGQVMPCIDFSHLHARSNGRMNTYPEFRNVLEAVETGLGHTALENMHIHVSGIAYTEKGEKHHLTLLESDLNWQELIRALRDLDARGLVISESPNLEGDAQLMKKYYYSL
ncbi:hypothetical protein COY95_04580 [Candidatus Woesearchaeota archaeon CG_4_10_14_0_8_um_filter_47_5]|nr:MAG: hypothetical protein COY95_04580 [Candidatus Woesearchaeota archaeon CG_4_10_14_0_8_um_filter_47_5]